MPAHIFTYMGTHFKKLSPFVISVAVVFAVTTAIIFGALAFNGSTIRFEANYYFVCYTVSDNALSADAISDTVSSYGGAGYVLEYDGNYYVTVACYYSENEANRVKQNLLKRGLNCSVLSIKTNNYSIQSLVIRDKEQLYLGNLNTLHSLSELCYKCANGLDTGEYGQSSAKSLLADVKSGLNGLKNANNENCFYKELRRLIAECEAIESGYIYSKNMRKLQIAITDTIINIDLY